MSERDVSFWFGGFCGSALASVVLWLAWAVAWGEWHQIIMDQAKVDAYRAKVAAEKALRGEQ